MFCQCQDVKEIEINQNLIDDSQIESSQDGSYSELQDDEIDKKLTKQESLNVKQLMNDDAFKASNSSKTTQKIKKIKKIKTLRTLDNPIQDIDY